MPAAAARSPRVYGRGWTNSRPYASSSRIRSSAAAYPDAVEQAHAEHALRADDNPPAIVRPRPARVLDPIDPELAGRIQGRPLNQPE
ncbi:hypothetical protein Aca07nite_56160 [Actinoplanes capillaceus]|uniref:Uncharacterized protein n=2 Tax=Actinoplanes campanulatus TaxID=113559 RepID=A0ABQ3WQ39_9ACTN|nr:hypothetical protein Aca07nite_56160 [Actinoplanes capillaceus]